MSFDTDASKILFFDNKMLVTQNACTSKYRKNEEKRRKKWIKISPAAARCRYDVGEWVIKDFPKGWCRSKEPHASWIVLVSLSKIKTTIYLQQTDRQSRVKSRLQRSPNQTGYTYYTYLLLLHADHIIRSRSARVWASKVAVITRLRARALVGCVFFFFFLSDNTYIWLFNVIVINILKQSIFILNSREKERSERSRLWVESASVQFFRLLHFGSWGLSDATMDPKDISEYWE